MFPALLHETIYLGLFPKVFAKLFAPFLDVSLGEAEIPFLR